MLCNYITPKMPSRKSRKTISSELAKLVYQNKIMMKFQQVNTADVCYGLREANSIDVGAGKVKLSDRSTGISGSNNLPLVMIPLRSIINGGVTSKALFSLRQNGYDFNQLTSTEFLGGRNLDADPTTATQFKKMLHRNTSIKMLLWQLPLKDVKYEVKLVRILNRDLDPITNPTTLDPIAQDNRKLFYRHHLLTHQLTNPILKGQQNFTRDIKGDYKILMSKTIHIQEQSVAHDQAHYEQIDLFESYDHMLSYTESPTDKTDTVDDTPDPDEVNYTSNSQVSTSYPDYRANIWLLVTANTSLSDRDEAVNYDEASFDIALKSKYTVTTQDLFN